MEHVLDWRGDHGYYPVHLHNQYGAAYFAKYLSYAETPQGRALTAVRVFLTDRFSTGDVLDVGIGCGQFVEEFHHQLGSRRGVYGYDINPHGVRWLQQRGVYRDLSALEHVDTLTFWDSLEHLPEPKRELLKARVVLTSIPIFRDKDHALGSKHFRPDEHFWYFTDHGFKRFMTELGFVLRFEGDLETELGREDIRTYAWERVR